MADSRLVELVRQGLPASFDMQAGSWAEGIASHLEANGVAFAPNDSEHVTFPRDAAVNLLDALNYVELYDYGVLAAEALRRAVEEGE